MCKLSIIVPVYNMAGDGKLEYCIHSLLNQTLKDMEIITVDDKSTDDSLKILYALGEQYPDKIRVIESSVNGRQGAARNKGLRVAKGEFIGFMDSDDWVLPDTYECAIHLAEETNADVVGFDMCKVSEHTMIPTEQIKCNTLDQAGVFDHEKRAKFLLGTGSFITKIYRREFFFEPEFSFPENMSYEDNAVMLEITMRIKHFEHIPEVKYFYYQHDASTTHSITQKGIEDRMNAMRLLLASAKKYGVTEEFHSELEYLFAKTGYATTLFSYMQSDLKQSVSFIRKLSKEIKTEFPHFMENSAFLKSCDAEQIKLMRLAQKSAFLFYVYYKAKKFYRLKRYGRW